MLTINNRTMIAKTAKDAIITLRAEPENVKKQDTAMLQNSLVHFNFYLLRFQKFIGFC